MIRSILACFSPLFLVAGTSVLFASDLINSGPIDFAKQIAPIFEAHCASCHGAEEQNGGLSFGSAASAFVRGDSGKRAIVSGKPNESELIVRVLSESDEDRMPPDGDRLEPAQSQAIKQWIREGAEWPTADDTAAGPSRGANESRETEQHWSFRPIDQASLPTVDNATWPLGPIDQFIAARREAAGLTPGPTADPVALIRRATYGLTGLPPTPEEVERFVGSAQGPLGGEAAFTKLVDDLLARPAYGERWGRHWMDWVRYADTAGDNSDFPIPQAYLYRNYVIDSLNDDVPYDRFLTEQLAGDLLPAENLDERNRQTIATGYLAMARRFGSLVERYPWHLTIEDTIDNVGRTMLGMTIACARCHDHKFDPITTRDYYGLYGIFASTRYPFPGIELFQVQRDLVPLVDAPEIEQTWGPFIDEQQRLEKELAAQLDACAKRSIKNAELEKTASLEEKRRLRDELDGMLSKARQAGVKLANFLKEIPELPTAYAVAEADPIDAAIQIKGEPDRPGAIVPRKFPDVLGGDRLPEQIAASNSGRLQLARWITRPDNPLTARVIVNRVWQRHFGRGLVPSTSDFGLRGDPPTHPELLDWLADDFIRSGWSLKHLHRSIMNSRTYQLSSGDVRGNSSIDPDNQLYWKFNRQRLDAESIRDTLLTMAGKLDRSPQTEPHPFPPQREWEYTQHHPFKASYESHHRSVYQMTKRLTAQTYMQTFDGPDPNVCTSSRDQSVTSLQALYFINDEFLHQQAAAIADRTANADLRQRLDDLVLTILCRRPNAQERRLMLQHVRSVQDRLTEMPDANRLAWTSLAISLLRLNEFLYLD